MVANGTINGLVTAGSLPTLEQAKGAASVVFVEDAAALEVELEIGLPGGGSMRVWIGRDGEAYDRSRYADNGGAS